MIAEEKKLNILSSLKKDLLEIEKIYKELDMRKLVNKLVDSIVDNNEQFIYLCHCGESNNDIGCIDNVMIDRGYSYDITFDEDKKLFLSSIEKFIDLTCEVQIYCFSMSFRILK